MTKIFNMKQKILIYILLFAGLVSIPYLVPHLGWVSLFAFTPLLALADLFVEKEPRHRKMLLYSAFLLFNIATTFWINWISVIGAASAIAVNSAVMMLMFWWFIKSRRHLTRAQSYVFLIVLWVAWERVYQNIEISWPWLNLGNSFATSPHLVQWYEYTGFLGGSVWILLSNVLLYETVRRIIVMRGAENPDGVHPVLYRRGTVALGLAEALVVIVPMVISLHIYRNYQCTDDPVEVVAVQPNIDSYHEKHGGLSQDIQDQRLFSLIDSVVTPQTDYVITPETYTFRFNLDEPEGNTTYRSVMSFEKAHPDCNFILGAITYRFFSSKALAPAGAAEVGGGMWYSSYNTAMAIDTCGIRNFYHKSKLVPAVEIIPYQRYIPFLGKIMEACGGSSSSYGISDDVENLHCKDSTEVGVMICYESIYGDYFRKTAKYGADFVAVITNDGWWGDTPGYRQHFRYAKLRAIETRRDVVHVANTGISGFIDQRGDVVQKSGWWVPTAIRGTVNRNDKLTYFAEHGDFVGRFCCFMLLLMLAAILVKAIVNRKPAAGERASGKPAAGGPVSGKPAAPKSAGRKH